VSSPSVDDFEGMFPIRQIELPEGALLFVPNSTPRVHALHKPAIHIHVRNAMRLSRISEPLDASTSESE